VYNWVNRVCGGRGKGKRQKGKGKRQKAKGERQKGKGKKFEACSLFLACRMRLFFELWSLRSFPARFGACGVFNTLAREGWGGRRNVLRMRRISRVARCGDAGKSEKGLWNLREKFPKISLDFSDLLCYNSSC